eukprot:Nitzschia sp. Nitz4//scaffold19_size178191//114740//116048//NITZ4_001992-RA/size178191-processed-gene-0.26-mRNA-1//1//CDS//3329540726//7251//frame0
MGLSMTRSTANPHDSLDPIVDALETVIGNRKQTQNRITSTTTDSLDEMEYEKPTHAQKYSASVSSMPLQYDAQGSSLLSQMIPSMLATKGGLSAVPQETLEENLKPIVQALEKLDAAQLLSLEPSRQGPRVCEGQHCKPIHEEISPAVGSNDPSTGQSCVRYLHISEVPDQYSIGIFVFAPYSRIPLHDHPGMCVLSRVLYGDLQRVSLDLAREETSGDMDIDRCGDATRVAKDPTQELEAWRRRMPKGTKLAYKNHVDYLQAPGVTVLYPFEGNLHEFVAGPQGAAVLDVLLPPYDNEQNRDCTFYTIQDLGSAWPHRSGKEPCFIVPTGQPENFHCISGQYKEIGESDDYL